MLAGVHLLHACVQSSVFLFVFSVTPMGFSPYCFRLPVDALGETETEHIHNPGSAMDDHCRAHVLCGHKRRKVDLTFCCQNVLVVVTTRSQCSLVDSGCFQGGLDLGDPERGGAAAGARRVGPVSERHARVGFRGGRALPQQEAQSREY